METVSSTEAPAVQHADAVRLLHEMAAVVRTIFAVDAAAARASAPPRSAEQPAPVAPGSGGTAPAPGVPASIPVPGMALLQEIALLDE